MSTLMPTAAERASLEFTIPGLPFWARYLLSLAIIPRSLADEEQAVLDRRLALFRRSLHAWLRQAAKSAGRPYVHPAFIDFGNYDGRDAEF